MSFFSRDFLTGDINIERLVKTGDILIDLMDQPEQSKFSMLGILRYKLKNLSENVRSFVSKTVVAGVISEASSQFQFQATVPLVKTLPTS